MRILFFTFTITLLTGCAGLMKNDAYHLDRTNTSLSIAKCESPGKEGDLVNIDGVSIYFEPVRKFTMIGLLVPVIPINFGYAKDEIKLMFAPGWSADPAKWRIRLNDSQEWTAGVAGESRLGSFINFKVANLPDSMELQYAGDVSRPLSSARFVRHGDWIYRPVMGLEGEKLRGWTPGCAR